MTVAVPPHRIKHQEQSEDGQERIAKRDRRLAPLDPVAGSSQDRPHGLAQAS
jgi:hypothetical protein